MSVIFTPRARFSRWKALWPLALLLAVSIIGGIWLWRAWPQVLMQSAVWQRSLNLELSRLLQAVAENPAAAGLSLLGFSFVYGVLHALGPGHGKIVITTWLATHPAKLKSSIGLTLAASLLQGLVAIALVVVVLALLIGEFAILMNHWVSPPSLSDGDSDDVSVSTDGRKKGCYTFLIAGKDRAAGLTDTVLVGMLDTENKSLKFVSIPRDTAVNVSYKPKKMNQYYAAAENNGKDGVEALIGGAEQILGYRVDSYALFDVEVFVELIDAMGGIDFDVPVDMDYDDPGQDLSIHVQKGYQHLNGYQTMGVFRFRNTYANGDIGRIDVQHQLLKAMTSQFLKLHNIPNLNKLIDIYEKDVTTNLSAGNVMFYVKEFLKLDESAISFETIPANYSGTKNGMSYVFIHVDEWLDYLNTWLNPYTKEITSADVDILYESNGQVVATSGTVQGPNKW